MKTQDNILARKQVSRNSSIELLKLSAIFIIVISHITQTLMGSESCISADGYILNLNMATYNTQQLTLSLFRYFGVLGNTIFFVASTWFLLESDTWSKKKELSLAVDVWIVSVIILGIIEIAQVKVSGALVLKSLFPNIFANNWYLTCYLLFYPIHGILNRVIKNVSQRTMLRLCIASTMLYAGINFIKSDLLFPSELISWIAIYFIIAYCKYYIPRLTDNKKINIAFLIVGLALNTVLVLITNILGLHIAAFSDKLLYWWNLSNPFLILSAIGTFNLARQRTFHNKYINYLSGLSLLIYVIHENILVRSYVRPMIWQLIYENFGYSHVVLWTLGLSLAFFVLSVVFATLYKTVIGKLSLKLSNTIYDIAKRGYIKIESKVLSLK